MPEHKLNPLSLSPADAAQVFSKIGGEPVTTTQVREAMEAGAPVDAQGNINLVHLGAWLLKEMNNHAH